MLSAAVTDCTRVQVLYSPRALPSRHPAGMSLPFSSHIWVLGTRDPSPGRFVAWAPARVPYTDQRRTGLARAQVTRAGPYMECLPCLSAPPDPAPLPAGGDGVERGSPLSPDAAPVRLRSRGCTCPKRLPTPAHSARTGRSGQWLPHFAPSSGSLLPPTPHVQLQGGGSRVQAGGLRGWEKQSRPPSQTVTEGDPFP